MKLLLDEDNKDSNESSDKIDESDDMNDLHIMKSTCWTTLTWL